VGRPTTLGEAVRFSALLFAVRATDVGRRGPAVFPRPRPSRKDQRSVWAQRPCKVNAAQRQGAFADVEGHLSAPFHNPCASSCTPSARDGGPLVRNSLPRHGAPPPLRCPSLARVAGSAPPETRLRHLPVNVVTGGLSRPARRCFHLQSSIVVPAVVLVVVRVVVARVGVVMPTVRMGMLLAERLL
jgi:hypothetical protein